MNLFKKKTITVQLTRPKEEKNGHVWKATVYKPKLFSNGEDVAIHSERFWVEREAKAFKRAVESGLTRNTVKYEKVSTFNIDGFMG
jgi:hypothetical protein